MWEKRVYIYYTSGLFYKFPWFYYCHQGLKSWIGQIIEKGSDSLFLLVEPPIFIGFSYYLPNKLRVRFLVELASLIQFFKPWLSLTSPFSIWLNYTRDPVLFTSHGYQLASILLIFLKHNIYLHPNA